MSADVSITKADLIESVEALVGEAARLRKGIQDYLDGDYWRPRKYEKCQHGQYGYEVCEACIDQHFINLLKNT